VFVCRSIATPLFLFFFLMTIISGVIGAPEKLSGRSHPELESAELKSNIEYARVDGVSLRMDASIPEGVTNAPAAIIVHGGGWVAGDRKIDVAPLFRPLSEAGFAWFSISYRLAANAMQFGAAVDDVESAIRFVKSHATEFHVDPNRIALIGESAGGQLAAMAALRMQPDTAVKAVVGLYAPNDLITLLKTSNYVPVQIRSQVIGKPWEGLILAALAKLSPIENVRRDMPPFLLIHGTADPLVPFEQSEAMCRRMRAVGASCEIYAVPGAGHGIRWWESSPSFASAYKRKMVDWLEQHLSAPAGTQAHAGGARRKSS
jgi:alpha-L-fucosidase 2